MPEARANSPFAFLHSTPVIAVSALLAAQIVLFYLVPTKEYIPTPPPLGQFPANLGPWRTTSQTSIDAYTQSFLKADDTLTRTYAGSGNVELFVAFFKSQRGGVTPHSPKVCLPGNGWTSENSRIISVDVPGERDPIPVNRYIVSHDEDRKLVLYWYQNPFRVTANEYLSKFFLIWDALRYHRSDEALIRVVTVMHGMEDPKADADAIQFIRAIYLPLKVQMWTGPLVVPVQSGAVRR